MINIKVNTKLVEHFLGNSGEKLRRVNEWEGEDDDKKSERITWYIDSSIKPEGKKDFWIKTEKGTSLILERDY